MLKAIYKKSPVLIQNIFVTLVNIRVLYKKYRYLPILNSMKSISSNIFKTTQTNSDESLLQRLNHFITYATQHSSYYHERIEQYPTLTKLDELAHLPLIKKQTLKKEVSSFYSKEVSSLNSTVLHTSGTTGSPLTIKVSISDLQHRFRLLLKTMIEFGYDPQKPLGRISGEDLADAKNIYRKDYLNHHIFLSAFHLSQQSVKQYYDAIITNNIKALEGYPSVIYTMAKLFELNNLSVSCVKHVFTTAEKLHAHQKEKIESVFNCHVFDYYGSNDQSIFIFTCKNGHLHTANSTGILEVLNSKSQPVAPGEAGRMIVTSFTSHFMPLIRYDIGDQCIISKDQSCSCGSGGTIIDEIIGRDEDVFKTIDGIYITRFSVILKKLPSAVIESQLVLSQKNIDVTLYYCAYHTIEAVEFEPFEKIFHEKVGHQYKLTIIKVTKISKSHKGKAKAVIIEN